MSSNNTNQKSEAGLRNGAISLASGIMSIILILTRGIFVSCLLTAPLFAIPGLFFGTAGLKSTGKGKYFTITGIALCLLAWVVSLYILLTDDIYPFYFSNMLLQP